MYIYTLIKKMHIYIHTQPIHKYSYIEMKCVSIQIVKYNLKIDYITDMYIYTLITVSFVSARKKIVICITCSVYFLEVKK